MCKEKKLITEVDGDSHLSKQEYDKKRDDFLINQGYKVLHFTDQEVIEDVESVVIGIYEVLIE